MLKVHTSSIHSARMQRGACPTGAGFHMRSAIRAVRAALHPLRQAIHMEDVTACEACQEHPLPEHLQADGTALPLRCLETDLRQALGLVRGQLGRAGTAEREEFASLMGIEATSIPTERHGGGSAGCTRAMEAATTGARTPGTNAATAAAAAEPTPPNVATEGPDPEAPAKAMEAAASGESGLQGVLMPSEPPYPEVAPTAAKVSATARSASKSATAQIVP